MVSKIVDVGNFETVHDIKRRRVSVHSTDTTDLHIEACTRSTI
jgi:hypothetical protein